MAGPSDRRSPDRQHVALAEITKPHGLKGEMRLRLFNPDSPVLARRPAIQLRTKDGSVVPAKLRGVRKVPNALLIRLDGVDDCDAAEALRGAHIEVARTLLAPPAEDEFYVHDLIGCQAWVGDEQLGPIVGVHNYPTCDVLVVQRAQGKLEVPMTERYLGPVDVDKQRVDIIDLDGLE